MTFSCKFQPTEWWVGVAWGKVPETTRVPQSPKVIDAWGGGGAFYRHKDTFKVDWFREILIGIPCFPILIRWPISK